MADFNFANNNPFISTNNNTNNPFANLNPSSSITKEEDGVWINFAIQVEGTLVPIFGVKLSSLKRQEIKTSYSEEYAKQVTYKNYLINYLEEVSKDMEPGTKRLIPLEVFGYFQAPHANVTNNTVTEDNKPSLKEMDTNKIKALNDILKL